MFGTVFDLSLLGTLVGVFGFRALKYVKGKYGAWILEGESGAEL
jgi:hypothetical protein